MPERVRFVQDLVTSCDNPSMEKIAKYNQWVWAIAGTGVLAAAVLGLVAALWASIDGRRRDGAIAADPGKRGQDSSEETLVYCLPTLIKGTSTALVGLAVAQPASDRAGSKWSGYGPSWASCQLGERYGSGAVHNAVVWDLETGKQRLLLETRGRIGRFAQPHEKCAEGEGIVPCGYLYWELATEDTDGDGRIGPKDAAPAYLSDLDAEGLRRITPKDTSVRGFSSELRSGVLFLQVQRAADDEDEPIRLLSLPVTAGGSAKTAVEDGLRKKAEALLL